MLGIRQAASISAAVMLVGMAASAQALPALRVLVGEIGQPDANGRIPVELVATNGGRGAVTDDLPPRIAGELDVAGTRIAVALERAADQPESVQIAAGGFATLRFVLPPVPGVGSRTAILSLPSIGVRGVAIDLPDAPAATLDNRTASAAAPTPPAKAPIVESVAAPEDDRGNAFLGNLSHYQPIYAVYGPGTSSDARIQISFKYQVFGKAGVGGSWLDRIYFAYTQRLYWDLGRRSSPFHNVDYMPEIFYLLPSRPINDVLTLGGQVGFRHESNGRDGPASRSLNTLYVQPVMAMPVGGYTLTVGPRLWAYVGRRSDNPDIGHYRGNVGLFAAINRDNGLQLTTTTRLNPGGGKGSLDSEISYPLDRLTGAPVNFYLFGQAFTGYGENLLDYNRRQTRLRIGLGIVR